MRNWNASRLARTCCAVRMTWRKACPKRRPSGRVAAEGSWRRSRIQKNAGSENSTKNAAAGANARCFDPSPTMPSATTASAKKIPTKPSATAMPETRPRRPRGATSASRGSYCASASCPNATATPAAKSNGRTFPSAGITWMSAQEHGCDERERDQERLAAPELVGERPGQRHGEQQEEDDDELRHRHVPVGPAQVVDDPRPEVADDEQEREDGVGEVPERPRQRCRVPQQVRASRHCAEA